jgi:hypothetical protein
MGLALVGVEAMADAGAFLDHLGFCYFSNSDAHPGCVDNPSQCGHLGKCCQR